MITSPAKAHAAMAAIGQAMRLVKQLEMADDNMPGTFYDTLKDARQGLAHYVSDEWDKTRTMECGAD